MLLILDAMANHYKEKRDTLLAWPWKLFCAQWARLMKYAHDERKRERERDEEREREREMRDLERLHARRMGSGMSGGW